jgi:hypothetical protein
MRKLVLALVAIFAICNLSFAGDYSSSTPKAEAKTVSKTAHTPPLNNVIRMDADGNRTALCCCGAEFKVTENAPIMDHDGTHFYMCGDGCKQMAMKATKTENAKTMKAWKEKYRTITLKDNTFVRDGNTWANCPCGKEFEVTKTTPMVRENGVKLYCHNQDCYDQVVAMSQDNRLQKEMALVKPAAEPKSDIQTGGMK